ENFRKKLAEKTGFEEEKIECTGCRNIKGDCQILRNYGFSGLCKIYQCVENKNVEFCSDCSEFPCDLLQPLAHGADKFPHNLKVFNLCMIQKMGLENWAKNKSKETFERYYNDTLDICV
ncbi:MAG: DUF3795 domain-containing protein, partial [Marinilabiliaceae bacterium]